MSHLRHATPPPLARRYVRYMLAFGVSVAVGLSPLLGRIGMPGFTAILSVFPLNLRERLIPFAAFLMSIPAVAVQFYAFDRIEARALRRLFFTSLMLVIASAFLLYIAFSYFVIDVNYQGSNVVRYVVASIDPSCPCLKSHEPLTKCIGHTLPFSPSDVDSCFDVLALNRNKTILSVLYLGMMLAFGTLIGALVVRENARRSRPSRDR